MTKASILSSQPFERYLWRISNHDSLTGEGGEHANGRWHTAARGKRIVYMAEHTALALIEVLVNLKSRPGLWPESYGLQKIKVEGEASTASVPVDSLSTSWSDSLAETRRLGDAWLARAETALLVVPSAAAPEAFNYLFNPKHRDASRLTIAWQRRIAYDKRLFQSKP